MDKTKSYNIFTILLFLIVVRPDLINFFFFFYFNLWETNTLATVKICYVLSTTHILIYKENMIHKDSTF